MESTLKTIREQALTDIKRLRSTTLAALDATVSIFAAEAIKLVEAQFAAAEALFLDSMTKKTCSLPPKGWSCSRSAGHEGPCAASQELYWHEESKTASCAGLLAGGGWCQRPSGHEGPCERKPERAADAICICCKEGCRKEDLLNGVCARCEADGLVTGLGYDTPRASQHCCVEGVCLGGDGEELSCCCAKCAQKRSDASPQSPRSAMGRGVDAAPDIQRGMRLSCSKCRHLYFPDPDKGSNTLYCEICATSPLPICIDATPKGCTDPYHAPECEGNGARCSPAKLICKNCEAPIDHGNCCSVDCTKIWMSGRRFTGDQSLCWRCGQPHEMKSNLCGQCFTAVQQKEKQ